MLRALHVRCVPAGLPLLVAACHDRACQLTTAVPASCAATESIILQTHGAAAAPAAPRKAQHAQKKCAGRRAEQHPAMPFLVSSAAGCRLRAATAGWHHHPVSAGKPGGQTPSHTTPLPLEACVRPQQCWDGSCRPVYQSAAGEMAALLSAKQPLPTLCASWKGPPAAV